MDVETLLVCTAPLWVEWTKQNGAVFPHAYLRALTFHKLIHIDIHGVCDIREIPVVHPIGIRSIIKRGNLFKQLCRPSFQLPTRPFLACTTACMSWRGVRYEEDPYGEPKGIHGTWHPEKARGGGGFLGGLGATGEFPRISQGNGMCNPSPCTPLGQGRRGVGTNPRCTHFRLLASSMR
eukprot:1175905-Prorocentrum_minimum.AAC.2